VTLASYETHYYKQELVFNAALCDLQWETLLLATIHIEPASTLSDYGQSRHASREAGIQRHGVKKSRGICDHEIREGRIR
jgi:hypothetical protein